jgi:hypothetical protein
MKGKLLTIGFSTVIVSLLLCSVVHASWSTLETGYAVTSNWEGIQIQSGTPVTLTAGTLDSTVTSVTFRWVGPPDGSGDCLLDETVPVYTNGTIGHWENGTAAEIRYAESTYEISQGLWNVQIIFSNAEGDSNLVLGNSEGNDNTVERNYWLGAKDYYYDYDESFFHVPEIALGTIGASVAMAAALGLFMIKKKRQQK